MDNNEKIRMGAMKKIAPHDILMLKADANYTQIYLNDGSHFLSSITLGKLEKRLIGYAFIRPNRSFLVNPHFIDKIHLRTYPELGPTIQLLDNTVIPIARRKTIEIEKFFL
jgi:DNA-binding LytR/AlgR family response regulator